MIIGYLRQCLRAVLARIHGEPRRTAKSAVPLERLAAALASLPKVERTVYLLHARNGVSLSDVAVWLDLSPIQTEQHLATALVHLDRQIGTISSAEAVAHRSSAD